MKNIHALLCLGLVLIAAFFACTPQEQKTATSIASTAINVTEDLCRELAPDASTAPDWVVLACRDLEIAGGIFTIAMPKAQWSQVKARPITFARCYGKYDAGPGK